jgi:RNA polymerase sigma-70 factor (ECF subfamily)
MTSDASFSVERLWAEFSSPLKRFLRARVRSDADADDLLQEVFSRIHSSLTSLHDSSKLQGWVYRIARNAVIDYYRSRPQEQPMSSEWEAEDPSGTDAIDLTPSLRGFVATLPRPYREPLIRHEFQGESLKRVADALGLSLTATKSRVQRARHRLRDMLDQCCHFEFDRRGKVISATPRSDCRCDGRGAQKKSRQTPALRG